MNYELCRKEAYKTSVWAGGKTREIFIYPKSASYADRDFDFRISSATVDLDTSTFTSLAGFQRYIMPLEGDMSLEHKGHHKVTLHPFEQDFFDGAWETTSFGKCTDFNLMLREGWEGRMSPLKEDQTISLQKDHFYSVFSLTENLQFSFKEDAVSGSGEVLQSHDSLLVYAEPLAKERSITFTAASDSKSPYCLFLEAWKAD